MKSAADWDAVIVGAGAGGAAAAYGLCQRGASVLLLEAGPRFDPIIDYPLTESDWETRDFPEKPGSTVSVTFVPGQKLTPPEPLLVSESRGMGPLVTGGTRWMEKYYHVRGVGGTTLHFTGESHRIHPDAMNGHLRARIWCPLLEEERTWQLIARMSACDPRRASTGRFASMWPIALI
jgi:choline dehydrogenase-like flavoprotein